MAVVADEADPAVAPLEPHDVAGLRIGAVVEDRDHFSALEPGRGEPHAIALGIDGEERTDVRRADAKRVGAVACFENGPSAGARTEAVLGPPCQHAACSHPGVPSGRHPARPEPARQLTVPITGACLEIASGALVAQYQARKITPHRVRASGRGRR
jgi:hypothetical protein